jgi:magnesium transporter
MLTLVKKRARWLSSCSLGNADGDGDELLREGDCRAVVLALFVPLVISSGGNSGSQAASLIIRALAGRAEVTLPRLVANHAARSPVGVFLGAILGASASSASRCGSSCSALRCALVFIALTVSSRSSASSCGNHRRFDAAVRDESLAPTGDVFRAFVAPLVGRDGLVIYLRVLPSILRGTLL